MAGDSENSLRESMGMVFTSIANTEVYNDDTFGVLELTLHPKRYDWEFVPVRGETFSDSGIARCH
jgi:hypothetical protein